MPNRIPYLPDRIERLGDVAVNLSWTWHREARTLFRSIDKTRWEETKHNPIAQLQRVPAERLKSCAEDAAFLAHYEAVEQAWEREQTTAGTWFAHSNSDPAHPLIAYFSAEFAFHSSVPIYSGGLGVLAGDHCKAASDLGVPLIGVGLLYTKGYFDQHIRSDGWQEAGDASIDDSASPLTPVKSADGDRSLTTIAMSGRSVHVGAWELRVGRVRVYLLDTDFGRNDPADRELTHKLYAGGRELRLRQEWILGVAGVRILRTLDLHPDVWHANEGHAAFMFIERLRELAASGVPFEDAVKRVRAQSIFTTHTPVPAGHDIFTADQVEKCAGPLWEELGIDRDRFFALGHHPTVDQNSLHMTATAIRLSSIVNGVAELHGATTRKMWRDLWPKRDVDRVPIIHITNGVHVASWMYREIMALLDRHLGPDWWHQVDNPDLWKGVLSVDDAAFWETHLTAKGALIEFIGEDARRRWRTRRLEAARLVGAGMLLSPQALTIGFARRFATYKRADLVFRDVARLRRLLVDPAAPVQLIFAGKAHPADEPGKKVLQSVYNFAHDPQFEGRVAFIEDYELHVAHRLVQGVDLWLNLPRLPMEACGTSGMKAALNGIPQVSTADGWWAEGYAGLNGWSIPPAADDEDADLVDADRLLNLLEKEIVPLFYERDERGIPVGWVERMKHALAIAGERFTARRMVQQYVGQCYLPAYHGTVVDVPPTA